VGLRHAAKNGVIKYFWLMSLDHHEAHVAGHHKATVLHTCAAGLPRLGGRGQGLDLLYNVELRIIGSAVLGASLAAYLLRVRAMLPV
jgi:hypothetical protein